MAQWHEVGMPEVTATFFSGSGEREQWRGNHREREQKESTLIHGGEVGGGGLVKVKIQFTGREGRERAPIGGGQEEALSRRTGGVPSRENPSR